MQNNILMPGDAAGNYDGKWTKTFDLTFLILWLVLFLLLLGWTVIYDPKLFSATDFSAKSAVKLSVMMILALLSCLPLPSVTVWPNRSAPIWARKSMLFLPGIWKTDMCGLTPAVSVFTSLPFCSSSYTGENLKIRRNFGPQRCCFRRLWPYPRPLRRIPWIPRLWCW